MFKRILTAIVGIPAAVFLVTKGGLLFSAAVLILAFAAWREYARMTGTKGVKTYYLTSFLPSMLLVVAAGTGKQEWLLPILALSVPCILSEGLFRHCNCDETNWPLHTSNSLVALLYVGLLFAHISLMRTSAGNSLPFMGMEFEKGELSLWMVLLGTWASDTFAYFFWNGPGKT